MQTAINLRKANNKDFEDVCKLLVAEHLPASDINPLLENFFIAEEDNKIAGVIGMDRYGNAGLLRSFVVKKKYQRRGVGAELADRLFAYAKNRNVQFLYLITNTAENYFEGKGFKKISRNDVPEDVLQSKEFNGLCPASSIIMFLEL